MPSRSASISSSQSVSSSKTSSTSASDKSTSPSSSSKSSLSSKPPRRAPSSSSSSLRSKSRDDSPRRKRKARQEKLLVRSRRESEDRGYNQRVHNRTHVDRSSTRKREDSRSWRSSSVARERGYSSRIRGGYHCRSGHRDYHHHKADRGSLERRGYGKKSTGARNSSPENGVYERDGRSSQKRSHWSHHKERSNSAPRADFKGQRERRTRRNADTEWTDRVEHQRQAKEVNNSSLNEKEGSKKRRHKETIESPLSKKQKIEYQVEARSARVEQQKPQHHSEETHEAMDGAREREVTSDEKKAEEHPVQEKQRTKEDPQNALLESSRWGSGPRRTSTASAGEESAPNFGLSGKLAEESRKVKGVVVKFSEPPEARKPDMRWRLYIFKGGDAVGEPIPIHRQSCYLFGRDRAIADIPTDHPSCSKQHSALQFRSVEIKNADGSVVEKVKPYLMDLESVNGTFINREKVDSQRYYELLEQDTIRFGLSSREYVLLHEGSIG